MSTIMNYQMKSKKSLLKLFVKILMLLFQPLNIKINKLIRKNKEFTNFLKKEVKNGVRERKGQIMINKLSQKKLSVGW